MRAKVPLEELQSRMRRLREKMDIYDPQWEVIVIFSKVNLYYLTGTMQDGMFIIPRWQCGFMVRALSEL